MNKALILSLLATLVAGSVSGAQASDVLVVSPMKYFRQITPGIFKGQQPLTREDMKALRDKGIRTIIDVQGDPFLVRLGISGESQADRSKEQAQAAEQGIRFINMPMSAAHELSPVEKVNIDKTVELLSDPSLQPVYIHCNVGTDRTGLIVALYRVLHQNCSYARAHKEWVGLGQKMTPVYTIFLVPYLHEVTLLRAKQHPDIYPSDTTCQAPVVPGDD